MQHIWQFTCNIKGIPHEGEIVTDKSRKNKIIPEIIKKFPFFKDYMEQGLVKDLLIGKIR